MKTVDMPKLLMVETDPDISGSAGRILSAEGWEVVCAASPREALEHLRAAEDFPFALVITGSGIPASASIDFLTSVSSLSPQTQRMLWIPRDKPELLIDSVNTAGIHACMTYPLKEDELKTQAAGCLDRFNREQDQIKFKRMVSRHNKKMFLLAKNLKKKGQTDRLLLDEKKAQCYKLEFELRRREREAETLAVPSLGRLVNALSIENDPDLLAALFTEVSENIKASVSRIAKACDIDWQAEGVGEILHRDHKAAGFPELSEQMIQLAYHDVTDRPRAPGADVDVLAGITMEPDEFGEMDPADTVASYFDLVIEENGSTAWLKRKQPAADSGITREDILEYMTDRDVTYGRVENAVIDDWLASDDSGAPALLVAEARMPVPGRDGRVTYHFQTRYENPGAMRDDGSIDFRERGEVPYVEKGVLLAEKRPAQPGEKGVNVLGEEIFSEDPLDPVFTTGHGAALSEDGLSVYAADNGQPHVDPLGTITVNPEFVVKGDVDFNTGNIDFKGNIVVRGTIKQGFSVTGVNLTADEVEGATISLTGDLDVSSGITNADIKTVGNIRAKFIHNSTVLGFGDFHVLKEVIDSDILLSGCCDVTTGHVIASSLSAKRGIHAGKIGTPSSAPPVLKVGTEKHIVTMLRRNKSQLTQSLEQIQGLKEEIMALTAEDERLQTLAAEKNKLQEAYREHIEILKKRFLEAKEGDDTAIFSRLTRELKASLGLTKKAAEELHDLFSRQDTGRRDIRRLKREINQCEEENIRLMDQKRSLTEYAGKNEPDPTVFAHRSVIQGTQVQGPHASLVLDDDKGPVKIQEICVHKDGRNYYHLDVSPLN